MLLPARTAVLNYLYGVESADVAQIMESLKPQYGGERQFTKQRYLDHCLLYTSKNRKDKIERNMG